MLKFDYKKRFHGVMLSSGKVYQFSYTGYEHDPAPMCIFLYWVSGNHPTTKRQWRFMQCINLHYISRSYRKEFVEHWGEILYRTRNLKMTWNTVKRRFPEMEFATRRYFYSPSYYVKGLRAIPLEDLEKEVVGSLVKDYSVQARIGFWSGMRKIQNRLSSIMSNRQRRR